MGVKRELPSDIKDSVKADSALDRTRMSQELRRIVQNLKFYYDDNVWPRYIEGWKNYFLYNQDRAVKIKDFQTNVKLPIVKMFVDTMWTAVYDNQLQLRVSGRTAEFQKTADSMFNFLTWAFSNPVSGSRSQFMEITKEALINGNGYGRIGFMSTEREMEWMKGGKKVSYVDKEETPFIRYVSQFDMFFDPAARSFEDSPYHIERRLMWQGDVIDQYGAFVPGLREKMAQAMKSPFYVWNVDFNRVKWLSFWNRQKVDAIPKSGWNRYQTHDLDVWQRNWWTPDYKGGYVEVLEYWEDRRWTLVINGHEMYDGINPLPVKKTPYFDVTYNKAPGLAFGHGIATSQEHIQQASDTIFNLFLDNMKLQVAPMFQKPRGGDAFGAGSNVLSYEPFKIYETNSPDAIQRIQLGTPDVTGENVVDYLVSMGEKAEGLNSYAIGAQGKVERSATGVSALVQAFKSRLLPMVESMNVALSKIADVWSLMGVALMPETISANISSPEEPSKFVDIPMKDLLGKYKVEFDAQSLKTATREIKRAQLSQVMQLAAQAGVDPLTGEAFINFRKLWGHYLDANELPSSDLVMSTKDVVKTKLKAQDIQERETAKFQAKKAGPEGAFGGNPGMPGQPLPYAAGGSGRYGFPSAGKVGGVQNPEQPGTIPQGIPQVVGQEIPKILKEAYQT